MRTALNPINPKKLLHSKWTAVAPVHREKHFLVTQVTFDDAGTVTHCVLEAVLTKREQAIDWHQLQDSANWRQGWQ